MAILVTGATGLFGYHISNYLSKCGYEVITTSRNKPIHDVPEPHYQMDLSHTDAFDHLMYIFHKHDIDTCMHFGAYTSLNSSHNERANVYAANTVGTSKIIDACVKNKAKLVFNSSCDIFKGKTEVVFEEDQPNPDTPYTISKYASELDILSAARHFGLKYTIFRPHNVVGTHQNIWDLSKNVVGIFIANVMSGKDINIYGGEQTRQISDIRFMYPAYSTVLTPNINNGIYNIGSSKAVTIKEVAETVKTIGELYGYKSNITYEVARKDSLDLNVSHDLIQRFLGVYDNTDIYTSIQEIFKWAIENEKYYNR